MFCLKVLALLGSPRKDGNTAALLDSLLKGIQDNKKNSIKKVYLNDKDISPCQECNHCQETHEPCIIKDDMQELLNEVKTSDILIFASPVFWWNISAQLKLFIDRLYSIEHDMKGKKAIVVVTYAGDDPNTGPEIIKKMFAEISDFAGIELVEFLGICSGTKNVADNPDALERAYMVGKKMT